MRISDWSSDVCSSDLLARRIDARLDQPHIFIEDRVLGGDPEREDAVEPALDRRQLFEERAILVSELETGHGLEALHVHARQFVPMEKMIPLGESLDRKSTRLNSSH